MVHKLWEMQTCRLIKKGPQVPIGTPDMSGFLAKFETSTY